MSTRSPLFSFISAVLVAPPKPSVTRLTATSVSLDWTLPQAAPAGEGLQVTFLKVQYRTAPPRGRHAGGPGGGGGPGGWQTVDEDLPAQTRSHRVTGLKTGEIP